MSKQGKRRAQFSGVYGAVSALLAYTLVQAGVVPQVDVPFLIEAGSAVLGALGGLFHESMTDTDTDGVQQREDQK